MSGSPTTPTNASLNRSERIAELGFDYPGQSKAAVEACNLCGGDYWTVLTHRDRYGYPATATACNRCALTVLNPRMTSEAYSEFYQRTYRPLVSAYHGRLIDAQTVKAEQAPYAVAVAEALRPYLTGWEGRTFLDVGGSTGVVTAHLCREFGLKATLIDPAAAELAEAEALGIQTVAGFVEDWDPGQQRFDLVAMFQTIDHLLDATGTLAKLRALIAEDGLFFVDIVDFRAAYLRNWCVEEAVKIDHPYSLTQETAEAYLRRAGFRPIRKIYAADHLHVGYLCASAAPEPDVLPSPASVDAFFQEIRLVHNAPAPGGAR